MRPPASASSPRHVDDEADVPLAREGPVEEKAGDRPRRVEEELGDRGKHIGDEITAAARRGRWT